VNGSDIVVGVVVNQSINIAESARPPPSQPSWSAAPYLLCHHTATSKHTQSHVNQATHRHSSQRERERERASTSSSVPEAKLRNNISSPNVSNVVCTNATDRQSSIGHEDAKPHHDIPWPSYSCCEAKQTLDQRLALTLTHAFIDGWCKMRVPYSWNIVVREGVARESNQQACLAW